jgi:FtsP/CotA-like multicopper oxidase with cupredoxin domain
MKRKLLTGFAVLSLGLAANTASAADYHLCTGTTTVTMPDGVVVNMWGYGLDANGDYLTVEPCNVTVPGPALTVSDTDTALNVFLRNDLSQEAVSLIIPGQAMPTVDAAGLTQHAAVTFNPPGDTRPRVQSFVGEAAINGGTAQYHWAGIKPGTYVYHSGSHAQIQVQMGLYGAVTAQDVSGNPYAAPAGAVVSETTIVYSEIDPALHAAVSAGNYTSCVTGYADCNADFALGKMPSTVNYQPVYFLVNGKAFTDKLESASWIHASTVIAGSEQHLLRFINTGIETHVPVLRGADARWSVIAENGRLYTYNDNGTVLSNAKDLHSLVLPALSTKDVLLTVTPADAPKSYAIYDRMLNVTNGAEEQPGGMISFLFVDRDNDSDGVPNYLDNCVNRSNPGQVDTIGNGFGDACNFDVNNDGNVDFGDVITLLASVNPPTMGVSLGDFDNNNIIDFGDLITLLGFLNQPLGPSCDPLVADPVICPLL